MLGCIDEGASRQEAVEHAVTEVGPPVLIAGLTTALGFLSFLVMNIAPMREFGLWMAVGTLLVVLLGMLVVPAACVLLPLRPRSGGRTPRWAHRGMTAVARAVAQRPLVTLPVLVLMAFFASLYITLLPAAMDMRAFFAEDSEPVRAEDFLEQQLGGSVFLQVEAAGDAKSPLVLRQMERLAHLAESHPAVSNVQSVLVPVTLAAEGLTGQARIPPSAQATRAIASLIEDDPNLKLLVDREWRHTLLQIKLRAGQGREAVELARSLRESGLAGGRVFKPRTTLTDAERAGERAEVLAHLRTVAGSHPGLEAALDAVGTLPVPPVEACLRANIEEDELVYLKDGADLPSLARRLRPGLLAGTLDVDGLYAEIAGIADPEELKEPAGLRKAVVHIHGQLTDLAIKAATDARIAAVVSVAPDAEPTKVRRVLAPLADLKAAIPAPPGAADAKDVAFTVSGYPLVYEGMNQSVQRNQTLSLMVSMVLVVLTLSLFFRSLRIGVVATIPAGLTLLVMFAVMGLLRIPMDVGTSMIASIALGVGIDYAVHLVWRHGLPPPEEADAVLEASLGATGWGIVINALEVTVGFGLLVFGTLVPTQNVGLLTAVAMLVSATSTLALVPALVRWATPRRRAT